MLVAESTVNPTGTMFKFKYEFYAPNTFGASTPAPVMIDKLSAIWKKRA